MINIPALPGLLSVEKLHLPLSLDRRSDKWPVQLALNMANVLAISVLFCSELQTSDSQTNWQGNKIYTAPGLLATSGAQLSQRGKRILGHELAGLIERALN